MISVSLPRDEALSLMEVNFKQDHKMIPNFLLKIILCLRIT